MKVVLMVVGVILILLGAVWILQGFNILPVGFMAGQMQYALLGAILVIAGIVALAFSRRRRKEVPAPNDNTQKH